MLNLHPLMMHTKREPAQQQADSLSYYEQQRKV
jgi:hypothetical protein